MQVRPLGRSGLKVSVLALGTMTFGEFRNLYERRHSRRHRGAPHNPIGQLLDPKAAICRVTGEEELRFRIRPHAAFSLFAPALCALQRPSTNLHYGLR